MKLTKLLPSVVTASCRYLMPLCAAVIFCSCQAPQQILEAEAAASRLEDSYQAALQERIGQWSSELEESWGRELTLILTREIEKNTVDGKIEAVLVLDLLEKQSQARNKNKERLSLERQADRAAVAAWSEARGLRVAIRRWLEAGQTAEQRDEIYKLVAEEVATR